MIKTFRLIVEAVKDEDWTLTGPVRVDVTVEGDNIGEVCGAVFSILDSGPFAGDWVDQGTERKERSA